MTKSVRILSTKVLSWLKTGAHLLRPLFVFTVVSALSLLALSILYSAQKGNRTVAESGVPDGTSYKQLFADETPTLIPFPIPISTVLPVPSLLPVETFAADATYTAAPTDTSAPALTPLESDTPTATDTFVPEPTSTASFTGTPAATSTPTPTTSSTPTTIAGTDNIKLGVILPLSGVDTVGLPLRNAIQLAVDQANARGGVKLADGKTYRLQTLLLDEVSAAHSFHDPYQTMQNADIFIADPDVMAVLGPFYDIDASAMMAGMNMAGLCQISPATTATSPMYPNNTLSQALRPSGKVTYFQVLTRDKWMGPAIADWAVNRRGFTRVSILDDTYDYGKYIASEFSKQFESKGGIVLSHNSVPENVTDYRSILLQVIAPAKPDFVLYAGHSERSIALARKQMKEVGLNIPLLDGAAIFNDSYLIEAGESADGTYVAVPRVKVDVLPGAKQFLDDYKAAGFSEPSNDFSGSAYDAANIVIDSITRSGKKDRQAVCQALRDTSNFPGVIGPTSFDGNGDTTNNIISIYAAEKGVWKFIEQFSVPEP